MKNLQKSISIFICAAFVLMLGAVVADNVLAQGGLPPRPSTSGSSGGGGGGSDSGGDSDDSGIILGDITGHVIDRSTGEPGRGLTVMINDIPIKTDASGHFSLTGIADGTYAVDLSLPAEFTPAQERQIVNLVNREKIDLTLEYYSAGSPQETPVGGAAPAAEPNPETPQTMPKTGGFTYPNGFIFYLFGIFLWTFGMVELLQKVAP